MKYISLLTFICFIFISQLHAQVSKKDQGIYQKAEDLYKKQKFSDAIDLLKPAMTRNEDNGYFWDLYVQCHYGEYQQMKDIKISLTDPRKLNADTGITVKGDTAGLKINPLIQEMLSGISPAVMYKKKLTDACRDAERLCEYPKYASMYLRSLYFDVPVDTNISSATLKYYNLAEDAFSQKNFHSAVINYKKAIELQPYFYRANLYLGDAYYFQQDYGNAAKIFRETSEKYPYLLEPKKYLVDALYFLGNFEDALNENIKAIMIYPDAAMWDKLALMADKTDKKLERHWLKRDCNVAHYQDTTKIFGKDDKIEPKGPWVYYAEAFDKIRPYIDEKGFIKKDNPLTKQKYLEVYCWEYMLSKSDDASLDYARRMKEQGMLDCYVLVDLYHFDLMAQMQDLVKSDPARVEKFLRQLVI